METPSTDTSTQVTSTDSTTKGTHSDNTFVVPVSVTMVVLFVLLATMVALLFLVYYKRKRSALVNLTKPHKGSEENSYASSEHSHQQGSKYSESPEPGYDVIKTIQSINVKAKIFLPKLKSIKSKHLSDLLHYSETSSYHKTTGSQICEYSAPSTKANLSIYSQECGKIEQELFIADSEIVKGEASPSRPSQTIEMMYTAVQKKPKVNAGMDSEFEDSTPPPPPQTTEMMYTAVQKRPKDSILAEVEDDAPPVPPYMEKEDKETEATAKGSDEGSPPPVPPQTTEMLLLAV